MALNSQSSYLSLPTRRASGTSAVRKLRQYLSVKTQSETGGFSQEELLKIWKGLFYCMWVQDEPLLQEELRPSPAPGRRAARSIPLCPHAQ
uniref:Uncharacterized protein n=1 Tax=Sciurus vulgaris TaxID=55149 RepID=A0A8D2AX68_SCIVU